MLQNQLKFKIYKSDAEMMETDALEGFVAEIFEYLGSYSVRHRRPSCIWNVLDNLELFQGIIANRAN